MSWLSVIPGLRDIVTESDGETLPRSSVLSIGAGLVAVYDTVNRRISLAYDTDFGANAESIRGEPIAASVADPEDGTFLGWNAALGQWEALTPPGSGDINAPVDLLDPNTADDIGDGLFLRGTGSGNEAAADVLASGDIGWADGGTGGGRTHHGTVITTDSTPDSIPLFTAPDDCLFVIYLVVEAKSAGGVGRIWEFKRKGNSVSGTLAEITTGSPAISDDGDSGSEAWSASTDFSGQDVSASVVGEDGVTIAWSAHVQRIELLV